MRATPLRGPILSLKRQWLLGNHFGQTTNRKLYAVYNLDKMLELRKFAVHNSLSKAALIISSFFVTKGSEIF